MRSKYELSGYIQRPVSICDIPVNMPEERRGWWGYSANIFILMLSPGESSASGE